ncbi:MAG: hypothetical protein C0507_02520 [Cyanobacteria bacterium PR.3.49]|jgi:hypothetical protein|nr:hypothetical protein [Cyanobacteria bacterium PR.3.49]
MLIKIVQTGDRRRFRAEIKWQNGQLVGWPLTKGATFDMIYEPLMWEYPVKGFREQASGF